MNPFKKDGEMLPVASINSVYVDDVAAYDLFRPALILQDILHHKDQLGISTILENASLLALFNELLNHELETVNKKALEIATKYGKNLAKVLSTLYKPSDKAIKNRLNWTNEHWDYWKTIRHIYLVGGLTSPILTNIFYNQIMNEFKQRDITNVKVTFIEGSQNLGTSGMATLVDDGDVLLFDFGQTSIKRARYMKDQGTTVIESYLDPVESNYLFYKTTDDNEMIQVAKYLDDYIVDVIVETMSEVAFTGDKIYMSIANYVHNGEIYRARGGYGKLALLSDNYQTHLQQKLAQIINRKIDITLYHDTSAMALLFKDEPHCAVISLGTAFGVAFP